MRVNVYIDVAPLQLAMNMHAQTNRAVADVASTKWARKLARTTAVEFEKLVFKRARTKQGGERLWHMFKANRIGVTGAELFMPLIYDEKLRTGHQAEINYVFRSNSEQLRNMPSGRLRSYERDGVKGVYGDKRLGIPGTKYSQRRGYKFKDKRNASKTYQWSSQATDVEFGRTITVKPTSGKWLAVATGDRGVIFAKRRIINYSNWTNNGYVGFISLWREFTNKYEQRIKDELESQVEDQMYEIADTLPKSAQKVFNERVGKAAGIVSDSGKKTRAVVNVNFATPQMQKRQEKFIKAILNQ